MATLPGSHSAARVCSHRQLSAPIKLKTTSKLLDQSNFKLIKDPGSIYGFVLAAHPVCIFDIEQELSIRTGLRLVCSKQKPHGCETRLNQKEKKPFPASARPCSFVGIFAALITFPRKGKPSFLIPPPRRCRKWKPSH